MINEQILNDYNRVRSNVDKSVICHAPFTNLNFEQNGNITACCYNRTHVLGVYPQQSILQAWTSQQAEELRDYMRQGSLDGGCSLCKELIESRNFLGAKSLYYDLYASAPAFTDKILSYFSKAQKVQLPKVLEFEISNVCNLECEMCNGYFSSSIRKNREHLPPLPNPYDDNFIEQIAELIPYVTEMKFLGGEPFLVEAYLKIWERIIAIKPEIVVHITTNGTVLNSRIKDLLQRLNCCITVSLDSLLPDVYEQIRLGASFDKVMSNVAQFIDICEHKGNPFSIAICPMTLNWHELPKLVQFANERNINTHFNTVWFPKKLSIKSFHPKQLRRIISYLKSEREQLGQHSRIEKLNLSKYTDVINTIEHWLQHSVDEWKNLYSVKLSEEKILSLLPEDAATRKTVLLVLKHQFDVIGYQNYPTLERYINSELAEFDDFSFASTVPSGKLMAQFERHQYILAYQDALAILQCLFFEDIEEDDFKAKIEVFKRLISENQLVEKFVVERILNGNPLEQIPAVNRQSIDELRKVILESV